MSLFSLFKARERLFLVAMQMVLRKKQFDYFVSLMLFLLC